MARICSTANGSASGTTPKIFHVFGAYEYWNRAASLVHADPGGTELEDPAHVGIEEYLFTYLRTLDASGNRLPAGFVAKLQQTLAHYGVAGLERTTLLEESLFRVFKARERGDEAAAPVLSILERRLARSRGLAPRLGDDSPRAWTGWWRPRSAGSPR